MIGKTISHYKIIEKIGEGGMGEVYLAEDMRLHRRIALKFLPPITSFEEASRTRFQQEAQLAAALNHPNIITIYERGEYRKHYFIAMEFVKGKSLRELINQKEISTRKAIDLILQICRGISKAHQAGIIHRDIKPENILINEDGRVKILDFGLAKLKGGSRLTKDSTRLGTSFYMSPEQAQGETVDPHSDIFSIGVLFYELLTGVLPFNAEYDIAVIYSIVNEDPEPLSRYDESLPSNIQAIIDRALQKRPEERYQNIEGLIADLTVVAEELYSSQNLEGSIIHGEVSGTASIVEESSAEPRTIDELLEQRDKIDQLIASEFTKNVVIMFSDVVGSTAYFDRWGDLEGRAMLQRYTKLMFPVINKNNGKVIKTIGDGILASFHEPEHACRCAIEMQRALREDNLSRLESERIDVRLALHYGKAVVDEGDIYGDVVNVASRVEHRARAGEILISEALYVQVKDESEFYLIYTGEESFKGKAIEMKLYRLLWDEAEIASFRGTGKVVDGVGPEMAIQSSTLGVGRRFSGIVKILKPFEPQIMEEVIEESLPAELKNPYMNRVKIQNIEEFYGRKSEVAKIYSRIGASRPQSISIVGERRIGKSSLLNYIYHPKNRIRYLTDHRDFVFIFIDFQEMREINVAQFFQAIYERLMKEFGGEIVLEVSPDYDGFKKVVQTFDQNNLKFILIFDEFEVITRNRKFDTEFYSFFRSIANNYNAAYIVSSGRNLQSLCHSKAISDSPFFNIFSNLTLTQFSPEEAEELILRPAEKMGYSMLSYVPLVIDIAGFYPFFIQMACAVIFEYVKNNVTITRTLSEKVKEEFLDEAKVHFQQIWDICDEEKREVLLRLATGHQIPKSHEYVLKNLIKEGYVKRSNNRPAVFSSLFENIIVQTHGVRQGIKKKKKFPFFRF